MPAHPTPPIDLESLPGHFIRRLHQIAVAIFLQEVEPTGLTPVQYAVLQSAFNTPNIDQRTLAAAIGQDTSTIGGVVDRLEARGLLQRNPSPDDRRVRRLTLTKAGEDLLRRAIPAMLRAQQRMLQPLPPAERAEFMRMLQVLVRTNNELSRAPSEGA
jgi:MarR family transcriptional regulator, lower aerobic nicotinate degradation pathway regulator